MGVLLACVRRLRLVDAAGALGAGDVRDWRGGTALLAARGFDPSSLRPLLRPVLVLGELTGILKGLHKPLGRCEVILELTEGVARVTGPRRCCAGPVHQDPAPLVVRPLWPSLGLLRDEAATHTGLGAAVACDTVYQVDAA